MNRFGYTVVPVTVFEEHWTGRFNGVKPRPADALTATYERQDVRDAAMADEARTLRPGVLLVPFEVTGGIRVGQPPTQQVVVTPEGILPE